MVQWLRTHMPMQGTQVRSLVWEGPTCLRAAKPAHHYYSALVPQLVKPACSRAMSQSFSACMPRLLKPERPRTHTPQLVSSSAEATEAHAPGACALQQEEPLQ